MTAAQIKNNTMQKEMFLLKNLFDIKNVRLETPKVTKSPAKYKTESFTPKILKSSALNRYANGA